MMLTLYPSQIKAIKVLLAIDKTIEVIKSIVELVADLVVAPEAVPAKVKAISGIGKVFKTITEIGEVIDKIKEIKAIKTVLTTKEIIEILLSAKEVADILTGDLEIRAVDVIRYPGLFGNRYDPSVASKLPFIGGAVEPPPVYGDFLKNLENLGGYKEYDLRDPTFMTKLFNKLGFSLPAPLRGYEYNPEKLTATGCDVSQAKN